MTSLNNETALVTGSARGIGRAIAERYAALGANVVINYSTGEAQARETVAAIEQAGGTVLAVQANVARAADVDRLFDATLERFGSLDIVVVNAGVELIAQPLLDVSEEDFDRLYSINATWMTSSRRSIASSRREAGWCDRRARRRADDAWPRSPMRPESSWACSSSGQLSRASWANQAP
jgi:3-oxoacyl-[acyl-carrier protein] reductase